LVEIIELKTILANGVDTNRIKVRYLDPNVRIPEAEYSPIAEATAAGGLTTTFPTGNAFHDLVAGESLYPPYVDIRFTRVDIDGPSAVFTRPAAEGEGKTVEEELMVGELGLSEERIDPDTISQVGARKATGASASGSGAAQQWVDPGAKTRMVKQNVWMISQRDGDVVAKDYERILTEDFRLDDWQARFKDKKTGKRMRGVSVRHVSPEVARFGIKQGDVLIKVNGERVTSRASAIRAGKSQYQRGVRTFNLTFLSGGGREVIRTYTAPDRE
jgi:hypothetical protein